MIFLQLYCLIVEFPNQRPSNGPANSKPSNVPGATNCTFLHRQINFQLGTFELDNFFPLCSCLFLASSPLPQQCIKTIKTQLPALQTQFRIAPFRVTSPFLLVQAERGCQKITQLIIKLLDLFTREALSTRPSQQPGKCLLFMCNYSHFTEEYLAHFCLQRPIGPVDAFQTI